MPDVIPEQQIIKAPEATIVPKPAETTPTEKPIDEPEQAIIQKIIQQKSDPDSTLKLIAEDATQPTTETQTPEHNSIDVSTPAENQREAAWISRYDQDEIKALEKKAYYDPQSLTNSDWEQLIENRDEYNGHKYQSLKIDQSNGVQLKKEYQDFINTYEEEQGKLADGTLTKEARIQRIKQETISKASTSIDEHTAEQILGSNRPATNEEIIAAATQHPKLAERWGWTKTDINQLRELTLDPEVQTIISNEIRKLYKKIGNVNDELSPEEAKQLAADIKHNLPLLGEALKQSYFYNDTINLMSTIGMSSVIGKAPELNELRNAFIEQNLDTIAQMATREANSETGDTRARESTIHNLSLVLSMGNQEQKAKVLDTIDSNRSQWIKNPNDVEIFQSYFKCIFEHGSADQRINAANLVLSFYNNEISEMKAAGIEMMKSYYEQFSDLPYPSESIRNDKDPIYRQLTETVGKYVPDMDDLLQKVLYSGPITKDRLDNSENFGVRLVKNMETILTLEEQRPGICKVLRKEFGIRNFFRYSPDILIDQYDNRDNPTRKGVSLVALSDHNGAFSQDSSQRAMHDLFTQLQDEQALGEKIGLMIYEISDSRELVRAIANARKRTHDGKLSFGIVNGHGTEGSVQFGEFFMKRLHSKSRIESEDMENAIAPSIAGVFENQAPILFNSCSTGRGIVREASKLGLKVSGPTRDTSIDSYSVFRKDGRLDIEATWNSDKATYLNNILV